MLENNALTSAGKFSGMAGDAIGLHSNAAVPEYISAHYWWAYIHPRAIKVFERQWLINLILWGNYARLRDTALKEMASRFPGRPCKWPAFTAISRIA
jgi:hypothetical protein